MNKLSIIKAQKTFPSEIIYKLSLIKNIFIAKGANKQITGLN